MVPPRRPNPSKTVNSQQAPGQRCQQKLTQERPHRRTQHPSQHQAESLSPDIQQSILNVFSQAFSVIESGEAFKKITQEVKGHLFDRDFSNAFGQPEYLEVYALRWSAARALAYADVFARAESRQWFISCHHFQERQPGSDVSTTASPRNAAKEETSNTGEEGMVDSITQPTADTHVGNDTIKPADTTKVTCIGGGAGAEVVGLAAASRHLNLSNLDVLAIDIADWNTPIAKLRASCSTPFPLSKYASQAAREANKPLIEEENFNVDFSHCDILDLTESLSNNNTEKQEQIESPSTASWSRIHDHLHSSSLTTIMFTLNELFTTSLPKTTSFLLSLTDILPKHSHLLVLDSPGSYSEISLGKDASEKKKYPMKWLLDHTLLTVAGEGKWEKVEEQDSVWYRLPDKGKGKLKYAVDLENMRYQIHVYRRS